MRRALTILLLLLGLAAPGWAATYHVACETGDNGNTGGAGDPFLTVQQGVDSATSAGDIVEVIAGETCRIDTAIVTKAAGASGNHIILQGSDPNNRAQIRASRLLDSGWVDEGGSVWSHSLPAEPGRGVWQDGANEAAWAREDVTCPSGLGTTDHHFCISGSTLYLVSTGGNPATRYTNPGVEVLGPATGLSGQATAIVDANHGFWTFKDIDMRHSAGAVVSVTAASSGTDITLENVRLEWSILNTTRTGGSPGFSGGRNVLGIGGTVTYDTVTVRNSVIANCGRDCFDMLNDAVATTVLMENVEIFNALNHNAIGVTTNGRVTTMTLRNVDIHDFGIGIMYLNGSPGADAFVRHLVIERSRIRDGVNCATDPRVFQLVNACGDDPHAIFDNGLPASLPADSSVTVRNSIIENLGDGDLPSALEISSGAQALTIHDNIIWDGPRGVQAEGIDASGNVLRDNIIGLHTARQVLCLAPCSGWFGKWATLDHNQYHRNGNVLAAIDGTTYTTLNDWQTAGGGANSQDGDPLFENAAGDDWHLAAASPAIGQNSTGGDIGPYPTLPTLASCEVGGVGDDVVTATWSDALWGGVGVVDNTKFDIEVDGVDATEESTLLQSTTETRTTLDTLVTSGQEVRVKLARGAVESIEGIGVSSNLLRAVARADTTGTVCTNNVGTGGGGVSFFPEVATVATSTEAVDTTTHTVSLPTGMVAGNLLLAFVAVDDDNLGDLVSFPAGWTKLTEYARTTDNEHSLAIAWREADGTEGATISVTTTTAQESAHQVYRLTGATTPPQVSTGTGGEGPTVGLAPDPDSLSVGAVHKALWYAAHAREKGDTAVSAVPTDYTGGTTTQSSADPNTAAVLSVARRALEASTEDPGAWTLDAPSPWIAGTVAVLPSAVEPTAVLRGSLVGSFP